MKAIYLLIFYDLSFSKYDLPFDLKYYLKSLPLGGDEGGLPSPFMGEGSGLGVIYADNPSYNASLDIPFSL